MCQGTSCLKWKDIISVFFCWQDFEYGSLVPLVICKCFHCEFILIWKHHIFFQQHNCKLSFEVDIRMTLCESPCNMKNNTHLRTLFKKLWYFLSNHAPFNFSVGFYCIPQLYLILVFSLGAFGTILLIVLLDQDVIEQKEIQTAFSACLLFSQNAKTTG